MRLPALGLIASLLCGLASATPPRIVSIEPPLESRDVDPDIRQVVVHFDQPMETHQYAFCGGGRFSVTFPNQDGNPYWRDDQTAVMPMLVLPERTYIIGINCPTQRSFRNPAGETLTPVWLRFTTGSRKSQPPVPPAEGSEEAWTAFQKIFHERYALADATPTRWSDEFTSATEWVLRAPDQYEWNLRVASVLLAARDPNLVLIPREFATVSTCAPDQEENINAAALGKRFRSPVFFDKHLFAAGEEKIGYLAINDWDKQWNEVPTIEKYLASNPQMQVLVLDLRLNKGGDLEAAEAVGRWFVPRRFLYARCRDGGPGAAMRDLWVEPNPPEKRFHGRQVIVLQGPLTAGASEAFLLMLRAAPDCFTLGVSTPGAWADTASYDLPNGAKVTLAKNQYFFPDGSTLHGRGVPPQEEYTGSFQKADPLFEEAWKRAECALPQAEEFGVPGGSEDQGTRTR